MKTLLYLVTVAILLSLILPSVVYAQSQQNSPHPHGIGSNSSALYNSMGLTYTQCQNKIGEAMQKTISSLDRGKAVALALDSPGFRSKVSDHKYALTDISTNDTWDNALCGNVKMTAVGVGFNLLDTSDTFIQSIQVAEDANISRVVEVGTTITPICHNDCPPALPPAWSDFIPSLSSDFFLNGRIVPNAIIPVGIDLVNSGNSTLYDVRVAFVDSPLLQNFKTDYGNFTLEVGQEKTVMGTMALPSQISNVSSTLNWMIHAKNQDGTTGSKEFNRLINLANISSPEFSRGYEITLPPLRQDVPVNEISCKEEFQLIVKIEDQTAACVTSSTWQKLTGRNWGESLENLLATPLKIEITGLNQIYAAGQPIGATIKYRGYEHGGVYPDVKIIDANGTQVWDNCCIVHTETPSMHYGTFYYSVAGSAGNPVINKTGTYTMVASLDNKTAEARFTAMANQTLSASFIPCNTPYPQSNTGVAVLYMPTNSTGKICTTYHNPDSPTQSSTRVFAAKDVQQQASEIIISAHPDIVPTGNSTIVYTIKTGSQAGLYGISFFCGSIPFAVGYDNQSRIILDDFPWIYKNDICLSQTNVFQITGLSGIHVKYVTEAHRS